MSERDYYFKDGKHYMVGGIVHPTIVQFSTGTFIVPWWISVPQNTTMDDVVWVKDTKYSQSKPDYVEVKSGSSDEKYRITKHGAKYHCTCPGYWRSKEHVCKHIKQVIKDKSL